MGALTSSKQERRSNTLDLLVSTAGTALLLAALALDWVDLLSLLGFPAGELNNPWVRADLTMLRALCAVIGALAVGFVFALRVSPAASAAWASRLESLRAAAASSRLILPLLLTVLVLAKTVLQLVLYLVGYRVYAADDFGRSLSAA